MALVCSELARHGRRPVSAWSAFSTETPFIFFRAHLGSTSRRNPLCLHCSGSAAPRRPVKAPRREARFGEEGKALTTDNNAPGLSAGRVID